MQPNPPGLELAEMNNTANIKKLKKEAYNRCHLLAVLILCALQYNLCILICCMSFKPYGISMVIDP